MGVNHLYDGSDERTRGVILATIAPGIAHFLYFALVEVAHLVLLGMCAKAQLIYQINHSTQVVAILHPVFEFAKYFANLILNRVGSLCTLSKLHEIGKEIAVYKIN